MKKTYKREVAFSFMGIVVFLFLFSIGVAFYDMTMAEYILGIAKYLMPFGAAMLSGAFGADWYAKQLMGIK